MTHSSRGLGVSLAGYLFLLAALACLAAGGWIALERVGMIQTWTAAEAKVLASDASFANRDNKGKKYYVARVELQYLVEGRQVTTKVNYGEGAYARSDAERHVASYPPGSRQTIHYNPGSPIEVRLDVGYNASFFTFPLVAGLAAFIFGGLAYGCLSSKSNLPDLPSRLSQWENRIPEGKRELLEKLKSRIETEEER